MMKKVYALCAVFLMTCFFISGCAPAGDEEFSGPVREYDLEGSGDLVYLQAVDGTASSFDQTPDWAPKPDPTAPIDGDMTTRWSSDYIEQTPWIYFDLGDERVVSNVIIRWERAHATEYKILVSSDAETWREVYHETSGTGNVEEMFFEPVKTRYVKVKGLDKVNEDWGISIWEFEIYGPAEANPDAEFTKDTYLARADEDDQRARAKDLIEKYAVEAASLEDKPFQKGFVFTSWMADEFMLPASDITLAELRRDGFDTVAIMVPAYQETLYSTEIYVHDEEGGDTPSVEALEHAIRTSQELGYRVHLKPHLDPRTDEPRINIVPSDEWFDSYEEFILKYAELAERTGVDIFSVGTELEATTFTAWDHRWLDIIDKTREVFSGMLTYAANWTEYEGVNFWEELDIIGIDAYFPLTREDDPTLEELMAAQEEIADDIEAWLEAMGLTEKGVIFTEIGYPSAKGANRQPWVAITDQVDEQEQAMCYESFFRVFPERDWFKGYYLWQYFPQRRWSPLGFTIRGKLAEDVIIEHLQK